VIALERSFGSDQTWSPIGVQPRVPTYGLRKTAHVFGAVAVDNADFVYQFADVFNGHTFHEFLLTVVQRHAPRKVFMIIDNGPCHWLDEAGNKWLAESHDKIELHRLAPYSPEFNPTEGVWKTTRKMATHNRFYPTVHARDAALRQTFDGFQLNPQLIDNQVARFRYP
jgi:hypothetical protein